jgi:RNA polymerase sigma factor (TIGR02999 family)
VTVGFVGAERLAVAGPLASASGCVCRFFLDSSVHPRLCYFSMSDVTRLLERIGAGEAAASDDLLPLVYDELRKLAAHKLAQEKPGQTLQATALVHEAYLRLIGPNQREQWDTRGHFFAAAAEAMRRLLVESARRKGRQRQSIGQNRADVGDCDAIVNVPVDEVMAIDDALAKLAAEDPQAAELVKLRYFAGLSIEEAAEALGISRATAYRHWTYARAWIRCEVLGE